MSKLLITLLLASAAATPALAAPGDRVGHEQTRAERQAGRADSRSDRADDRSSVRVERVERVEPVRPQVEVRPAVEAPARARATAVAPKADLDTVRNTSAATQAQRVEQRQDRRAQIQADRELRQSTRPVPKVFENKVPVVSNEPRAGTQPPLRTDSRRTSAPKWSSNWRHDGKYDWKKHRNRYRWLYHLGYYYDPYGWGYSPYQIGWRLWPSYYSSRYWLNNPYDYRLPYAPAGYRWVRYYDDALLIDTWTGEVVDVIYSFFW